MVFVWDEVKRLANIEKHGLDFIDIASFRWRTAILEQVHSSRFKAIGYYDDGIAVVIFAELGAEAISIISFRRANLKERKVLR